MKQEAKRRYKELFQKVLRIINLHDPAYLEPGAEEGSPEDEYADEAALIVAFLTRNGEAIKLDRNVLIREINRIWQEYFDQSCVVAERIAADIIRDCL